MNSSFYGGNPGQSFAISKVFDRVKTDSSNTASGKSLWDDLTLTSSDVKIGDYVLVSYGEPGSRLDATSDFYIRWNDEMSYFTKHFHGSVWRKCKYDTPLFNGVLIETSVIGYDTALSGYRLLAYNNPLLDKTKTYYGLVVTTAVEGQRGAMGAYERVISCLEDINNPGQLFFARSDKTMFTIGTTIYTDCNTLVENADDYTNISYILNSTTLNQIVGIDEADEQIHTLMLIIGNPNSGSSENPDDDGTFEAYGLLCTYDTDVEPSSIKTIPIDISDNILKSELFINSLRAQDSDNIFGFDSKTMGYSADFVNDNFIFSGNQLPLQNKNEDGTWDETDVGDYRFGYNIWLYEHTDSIPEIEYNENTYSAYDIKDCFSATDVAEGSILINLYEDLAHTTQINPNAEDAEFYDAYRNIESTPNTYYVWSGLVDVGETDQEFIRIANIV